MKQKLLSNKGIKVPGRRRENSSCKDRSSDCIYILPIAVIGTINNARLCTYLFVSRYKRIELFHGKINGASTVGERSLNAPPFTKKLCTAAETSRPSIFNLSTSDRKKARRARHIISERRHFKIPPSFSSSSLVTFTILKDQCLFSRTGIMPRDIFLPMHFNHRALIVTILFLQIFVTILLWILLRNIFVQLYFIIHIYIYIYKLSWRRNVEPYVKGVFNHSIVSFFFCFLSLS